MKSVILCIFSLVVSVFVSTVYAQNTLTIEIQSLKSNNGQVIMEFCNAKGEKISGIIQPVKDNKSIIVVKNLKPGSYSFKYFHDENKNVKMDTNWIGIPLEGFGFSNNAKVTFGPPDIEETIFKVDGSKTIICKPVYF